MIYAVFRPFRFLIAVMAFLVLTACSQQSEDEGNAILSGNSFYDTGTRFQSRESLDGVLYFADNGDLQGFDHRNGSYVLEGKWIVWSNFDEIKLGLTDVVIYTSENGFRHERRTGNGAALKVREDGSIVMHGGRPSKPVEGFSLQAEYDALLREMKSAPLPPPPPSPAPGEGAATLAQAAIMIPICIASAMLLCM